MSNINITEDDYNQWIGKLYIEARGWEKAARELEKLVEAKKEPKRDNIPKKRSSNN